MTKLMNFPRQKPVAVGSAISMAAALLSSAALGVTTAQAAPPPSGIKTFEVEATGTFLNDCLELDISDAGLIKGGKVTNGEGTIKVLHESKDLPTTYQIKEVVANESQFFYTLTVDDFSLPLSLEGSNWKNYSGSTVWQHGYCTLTMAGIAIKRPTTPTKKKKPGTPSKVKVAGKPTAKKFKVSWKAPKSGGAVANYKVKVTQAGKKKAIVNKKLGKSKTSITISRSALLKGSSSRSTRGEVAFAKFKVKVSAANSTGSSKAASATITVAK